MSSSISSLSPSSSSSSSVVVKLKEGGGGGGFDRCILLREGKTEASLLSSEAVSIFIGMLGREEAVNPNLFYMHDLSRISCDVPAYLARS